MAGGCCPKSSVERLEAAAAVSEPANSLCPAQRPQGKSPQRRGRTQRYAFSSAPASRPAVSASLSPARPPPPPWLLPSRLARNRQGGRWQTTSVPGVTVPPGAMSACTSFLPKLAHFCLLAPPLPLLSARAWRWSTRPRLRFRPSVSSSSPWSPRARLRPPSSRSLRWAQPTTQGHSLRRPRLRLWRRSIRPRRRSRAQDEQVRQRACSEGHEGERARPCGRATPRRF